MTFLLLIVLLLLSVFKKQAKEPLMAAYRNYDRALDLKAYNSYAAAGMGIVCAERGDFQKAREILSLVL